MKSLIKGFGVAAVSYNAQLIEAMEDALYNYYKVKLLM